jgi:hypothetical protein|tara:strand:+ start:234 stop:860 length:627 start_codon:yes stop_codon:yes gene_type:complete
MSNKLQNIKAVKEMIAGTHRTQTRKSHYYGSSKSKIKDEDILERDEKGNPKVWIETDTKGFRTKVTQHDGFKAREPENSILSTIQKILKVPECCPECGANMRAKEKDLNFKFYFKRGKCFDCVLKEESKIKRKGPEAWKEYESKIMSENAEAWFKQADKEVEILKTQMKQTTWENADGDRNEIDVTAFLEKMETDYQKLKDDIRHSLK